MEVTKRARWLIGTMLAMCSLGPVGCTQQRPAPQPRASLPGLWYRVVLEGREARGLGRYLRLAWGNEILEPTWLPVDPTTPGQTVSAPIHRSMLDANAIRLPPAFLGSVRVEAVAADSEPVARLRIVNLKRSIRVPFEGAEADMTACVILAREPKHAPTILLIHPPGPVVPMLAAGELVKVASELGAGEDPADANIVILEDHMNLVLSTPPVRWMHHHWIDSPVNGAWRTGLIEKLLPEVQKLGEGVLDPARTVIVGCGPGAWAAWWLFRDFEATAVHTPEGEADRPAPEPEWQAAAKRFDACILVDPEPFGFSIIELPALEGSKDDAAVVGGLDRLLRTDGAAEGDPFRDRLRAWLRAEDDRIKRGANPRPGLNLHSFERALSTQPMPEPIMDRSTGEFRPEVLERWRVRLAWPAVSGSSHSPWAVGPDVDTPRLEPAARCSRLWVVDPAGHGMQNRPGNVARWIQPDPLASWGLGEAEAQTSGLVSLIRTVLKSYRVAADHGDRPFGASRRSLPSFQ